MDKLQDLKMVLEAIKATRMRWITALESKTQEILMDDSKKNYTQAFSQAISHKEIHEEFQNLITLYSIVGSDVESYIKALEPNVEYENVIKLPKKAA